MKHSILFSVLAVMTLIASGCNFVNGELFPQYSATYKLQGNPGWTLTVPGTLQGTKNFPQTMVVTDRMALSGGTFAHYLQLDFQGDASQNEASWKVTADLTTLTGVGIQIIPLVSGPQNGNNCYINYFYTMRLPAPVHVSYSDPKVKGQIDTENIPGLFPAPSLLADAYLGYTMVDSLQVEIASMSDAPINAPVVKEWADALTANNGATIVVQIAKSDSGDTSGCYPNGGIVADPLGSVTAVYQSVDHDSTMWGATNDIRSEDATAFVGASANAQSDAREFAGQVFDTAELTPSL